MKIFLKHLIRNILSWVNVYPTELTDKTALQSLLIKLKPISFGEELIRLGPKRDGGYLVPNDLKGISACFSPGVDRTSGFEKDCANMGMTVFMADNSVEKPAETHEFFHFEKKYLGATSGNDFITLSDWVSSSLPESQDDLLLQMDIEGFEYEVILSAPESLLNRFRIIVIEFHHLNQLWSEPFFNISSRAFEKLLQTHSCVHNHPNNCCGSTTIGDIEIPLASELTFLRKDRIENPSFVTTFPHLLDSDNRAQPPLDLPRCWYS